jgi:AraC-like DNA-binding protein
MMIEKDTTKLDAKFPFRIMNQTLLKKDNREETFHWHSFCEITYVRKGNGHYFVNGVKYDMGEGDLIIFNNVELHGWTVLDDSMDLVVMIFPTEFVSAPAAMFDYDYLRPFIERGTNFRNKIGSDEIAAHEIALIMDDIMEEWSKQGVGYQLMIKAQVLRALTLLIRYYQKTGSEQENRGGLTEKKRSMKRLEEAFYYINAHYTEKITLEEVAGSVFMSPNYFSTYFKKVTSLGFSDYVTQLRIKKAEELEKTTDLNMAEIAAACGFHNMSNFYRLYKKHHVQ